MGSSINSQPKEIYKETNKKWRVGNQKKKSFTGVILFIQMPWSLKREFPKFVVASEAPDIKQLCQHGFSTQQPNQDKDPLSPVKFFGEKWNT